MHIERVERAGLSLHTDVTGTVAFGALECAAKTEPGG